VAGVSPTGTLQEGEEVTLAVYDKAKGPPEDPPGQGNDKDD